MSDTEIFHVYNENDIIEHDTEGFGCICDPIPSIQQYCDEDGNDIDEHLLLIVHRKVEDELEEKSFIKRFFKGFFFLW